MDSPGQLSQESLSGQSRQKDRWRIWRKKRSSAQEEEYYGRKKIRARDLSCPAHVRFDSVFFCCYYFDFVLFFFFKAEAEFTAQAKQTIWTQHSRPLIWHIFPPIHTLCGEMMPRPTHTLWKIGRTMQGLIMCAVR